ncbi:prophage LambdaSa1, N-acetylmuramoyl-L-alanine amidase, family 4 [Streptococcus pseudoporcinus]|uniref:Prophage LambdaSa1, N-acetylmuramoyl-L-alanine amidase, family 4 n=1 Tax=Streptococcus pseudoporcinus TaxID=361101 RepID=A0A4U9Y376_9STRE|nr:gp58-like family protein [Streptococcus pseudoporcinus]VTS20166.1 prophage LambdaSa1, N-acetylmuramoyl-L-alanine amidase, family 4 [Streptococcus pseudoporcinus]
MRIAIRDSTDSHTVGFFDNKSGIKFKLAEITQFLKGACSFVTIKYNSKEIDKIGAGCKLAFRFKDKDFWLTINEFSKKGNETEITAYSLNLEANKEKRGGYKASKAMPITDYFSVFDPEKTFEIGINEVSDKKLTLEWTGTDTVLARLYSIANSFDAELEFVTELNSNYSLKRHLVNIYRKGNLGRDLSGKPVRVGKDLKVLGFSSNINDLYTAIDVVGKDGLRLPEKTIKDSKGEVQFFSKNGRIYAPQARDKFPSNKVNVSDGYILGEAKTTEYSNQEALFGYALSEIKKHCEVQAEYVTEGAVNGSVGDTKTLIDSVNCEPTLYVQARITEQTEDLETERTLKTTFSNFKRTSSQLSADVAKRIEELAKEAQPYKIVAFTTNGTSFKNGAGQSIVTPKLFKGNNEIKEVMFKFNNTKTGTTYAMNASSFSGTSVLKIDAYVGNNIVASDELTFINVSDGEKGNGIESGKVTYGKTTSISTQPANWSDSRPAVGQGEVLWSKTTLSYTDKNVPDTIDIKYTYQGKDGALDEEQYNAIVAKNVSQDELISQVKSTADNAKANALSALSNIVSESKKLTDQMSALSKTEGEHYSATSQQLTQIDGTVKGLQTNYTALVNKDNEITQTLTNYKQTIDQNTAKIAENKKTADGTLSSLQTQVTQNKTDIATKASQLMVDNLTGRMSSAETSIKQTATEISTRLSQTSIESLINNKATVITDNKIKETSDSFSREITRVENKADSLTVKVNTVKDTVDSHTQLIGQQGSSLTATIQKVDSIQSSVSNIDGRLSTVTQTADGLVTTVQNLSVGGSNLLLNADFEITDNKTSFVVGGVTYSQGPRYWSTYNGGIPNATTSYHSYSGSFGGRNNVVIFNESDGSRNWKAITQSIGKTIMPDFPDTTNDFMLSFDAYANLAGTKLFGGFYYVNKLTGATNFHAGQFTINSITAGAWNRYSVKVPFNKDICDFSKTFSFLIYGFGFSSNAILAIDNVQLETGTISSAFGKAKKELDDKIASIQTTVTQTANSWSVKNLTSGGSILGQINLTDGTVKIDGKYVKITGQTLIDNGIITNAMIKDLTADKIVGGTIDASKISVINLNASNITSGQISGGLIKGGVLTALNGAMSIDLNKGQMEMYNDNPAIRRVVAGLPNQFIKFSTGTQPNDNNYRIIGSGTKSNLTAAITSIGTNRLRTENNLDGGFTGINIYAGGSGTGDSIVDRIEISSDILKIAHSANSSDRGWVFENINGINNQYVFRPNTTYQDTYKAMIGTSLNPIDEIYINEMYIKGQRLGYILKDIANRIGNVGAWASAIS